MVEPKRRDSASGSIPASSTGDATVRTLIVLITIVVATIVYLSLTIVTFFESSISLPIVITQAVAAATASGSLIFYTQRSWRASKTWTTKPYRASGLAGVRYQTAAGDYIKFEQYNDGVSANWSTDDGPTVLLSIPLSGKAAHAQFWTSEHESDELDLAELAPDLRRRQSEVIRAWIETDRELILWRMADENAAGIAQLGVLMRYWNPRRVSELVHVSATEAVQRDLNTRLKEARKWVDDNGLVLG